MAIRNVATYQHETPTWADLAESEHLEWAAFLRWLDIVRSTAFWTEPWTGETLFEATDGTWRSVQHKNDRRAFMTPMKVAQLKVNLRIKWTKSAGSEKDSHTSPSICIQSSHL